jgi:hypothetical protein
MQGLQRATEAARATRGLPPRIVHARSLAGGHNTICGRGGVTFSAPIADEPGEVTCKNCLKVQRSIASHRQIVARSQDARWAGLRRKLAQDIAIEQELGDDYSGMSGDESENRAYKHWGKAEALREVLAWMEREDGQP